MQYEANLENNLICLCVTLNDGSYSHGGYNHRILSDKKRRDIAVATVEDRIVHRLIYDFLVQEVDKRLDPGVWSGRKNKGLHKSLKRIAYFADKYPNCYVWRADITKFFDNVDHNLLKAHLNRSVTDQKTKSLLDKVIDSYDHNEVSQSVSQSRRGIPIGNLTSQVFSNIYLNEFDRYIRHQCKPLAYIRYGDDFLLFARSQNQTLYYQQSASAWLCDNLRLKLHDKNNTIIQPRQGVHILGHWIRPKNQIIVDKAMQRKMQTSFNISNISTYKSMHVPKRTNNIMSHVLAARES